MSDILVETIEKQLAKLPLQERIRLMEVLARQSKEKSLPAQ
jgi:hypothetical protein